jgi:intracellular septation protein
MYKKAILNLSIEFGPILVFVVLAEMTNFIFATLMFVLLTVASLIAAFYERRSFAWFPFVVAVSVIGFGLLTIITKNPFFFIFKDTIYNALFGAIALASVVIKKPVLKILFQDMFDMTQEGWLILTTRWGTMFLILAASNEVVRRLLSENQWVIYKIGSTFATAIFGFYQFTLSKKYRGPKATEWGMKS